MKEQTQEPMTAEQLALEILEILALKQNEPGSVIIPLVTKAISTANQRSEKAHSHWYETAQAHITGYNQAKTKIQELESKVLELTDALDNLTAWVESPGKMPGDADDYIEPAKKALSTPDTTIRERIKAEGFNEGVEECVKAITFRTYSVTEALARLESIKKGGV